MVGDKVEAACNGKLQRLYHMICRREAEEKLHSLISAQVLKSQAHTVLMKQAPGTSTLKSFPRRGIIIDSLSSLHTLY